MFKLTKNNKRSPYWQITGTEYVGTKKYYIRYKSTNTNNKQIAETVLKNYINSLREGTKGFDRKAIDVHEELMNDRRETPTVKRKVYFEKNAKFFGNILLSEIDQKWIDNYLVPARYPVDSEVGSVYEKYKGVNMNDLPLEEKMNLSSKYNTINSSVISPLRKLLNYGALKKYCYKTPVVLLPQISEAEKTEYVYTKEEAERCMQYDDQQIKTLFMVLYYTGMRLKEALSLNWNKTNSKGLPQIDLENQLFNTYVSKTFIQRVIPMHPKLYEWLRGINNKEEFEGRLFEWRYLSDSKNSERGLGKRWLKMNKLANVKNPDKKKRHALRHTFATNCSNNGANEKQLMETVGWKSRYSAQRYMHSNLEVSKKLIFDL